MNKLYLLLTLLLISTEVFPQNAIEWDGVYEIKLSDFQSDATKIGQTNLYSVQPSIGIGFSFNMTNAEFLFTKNFNSKVENSFKRSASYIIAPDSIIAEDVVSFGRFEFDLSELYARKFRQQLFENKGVLSNVNFFQPIFDKVNDEFAKRVSDAASLTDLGRNRNRLSDLHAQVKSEINELSEFCQSCKRPNRKK
jgi:hypothetical protein